MAKANIYSHAWLTSRGCPIELPSDPTSFEIVPTDYDPGILVGPKDSVIWIWMWAKVLRRQTIESISLTLPWTTVLFANQLTEFKTAYPGLYLIPDVGEFQFAQILNPHISKRLAEGQELDGFLVALSTDEIPMNLAHGTDVNALLTFQLSDGRRSTHDIEMRLNRELRNPTVPAQTPSLIPAAIVPPWKINEEIIGPDREGDE